MEKPEINGKLFEERNLEKERKLKVLSEKFGKDLIEEFFSDPEVKRVMDNVEGLSDLERGEFQGRVANGEELTMLLALEKMYSSEVYSSISFFHLNYNVSNALFQMIALKSIFKDPKSEDEEKLIHLLMK